MTLHLEWLRNNPKGAHGPIPQRAPKAPLGPFAPLGSLWFPWSLLAPCPWVPGPLGVGWGWGPRAKGSAPCRSDIRASRNCGGEAALPRRECTGSAGLRASVMDFNEKSMRKSMNFDGSEPRLALYSSLILHFCHFRKKWKKRSKTGGQKSCFLI